MHRILVNALSVTNPSGLHVLLGHLDRLADWLENRIRFVVLCREDMTALRSRLGSRVDWQFAPGATAHWLYRSWWEGRHLNSLATTCQARIYFTPSGMASSSLAIPQVVFSQNPWALVPEARRLKDAPKALLQRLAYRRAQKTVEVMVYNSTYMQQAYRLNAGGAMEKSGAVVYQAADDATHKRAAECRHLSRQKNQILCVSVMAPHKNIEAVVHGFDRVVKQGRADAQLLLVGSWPDSQYERKIRALVSSLSLMDSVHFTGFVEREKLDHYYASSQMFCLMSRCESFGIPALEAQLFGTPVISSNVCAVPEICGEGGIFTDPDDIASIATSMMRLLDDEEEWLRLSGAARANAARFTWDQCSRPLAAIIENVALR